MDDTKKYIVGLIIVFWMILELGLKHFLDPCILFVAQINVYCLLPLLPAAILIFYDPRSDRGKGPNKRYIKDEWVYLALFIVFIVEILVIENILKHMLISMFLSFYIGILMHPIFGGILFILVASYLTILLFGVWIYVLTSDRMTKKYYEFFFPIFNRKGSTQR